MAPSALFGVSRLARCCAERQTAGCEESGGIKLPPAPCPASRFARISQRGLATAELTFLTVRSIRCSFGISLKVLHRNLLSRSEAVTRMPPGPAWRFWKLSSFDSACHQFSLQTTSDFCGRFGPVTIADLPRAFSVRGPNLPALQPCTCNCCLRPTRKILCGPPHPVRHYHNLAMGPVGFVCRKGGLRRTVQSLPAGGLRAPEPPPHSASGTWWPPPNAGLDAVEPNRLSTHT